VYHPAKREVLFSRVPSGFGWVRSVFLSVVFDGYFVLVMPKKLGFTQLFRLRLAGVEIGAFLPFLYCVGGFFGGCER
jgi:hypothetical protein